ncbi:hypothetical protein P167DRAFT_606820 [Morchella conica CCBAS932]|uniref:Uncharacterized protein n=1 Tax=Morchella conica CCBAS932 TaxID=1392247 RepID=A0A3N4KR72_9PEZI|nr:hypothetical protein P167DRAFT_606820 [Morchella conica CCBAS932]
MGHGSSPVGPVMVGTPVVRGSERSDSGPTHGEGQLTQRTSEATMQMGSTPGLQDRQTFVQPTPGPQIQYRRSPLNPNRPQEQPPQVSVKRKAIYIPDQEGRSTKRKSASSSNLDILQEGDEEGGRRAAAAAAAAAVGGGREGGGRGGGGRGEGGGGRWGGEGGGGGRATKSAINQRQQQQQQAPSISKETPPLVVNIPWPKSPSPSQSPPPPLPTCRQNFSYLPGYKHPEPGPRTKIEIFQDEILERMTKWNTNPGGLQTLDMERARLLSQNTLEHEATVYNRDISELQSRSRANLHAMTMQREEDKGPWAVYDYHMSVVRMEAGNMECLEATI